jgi:hypothetical protein
MKNATKWDMFAIWPKGHYGDILGQNHKILSKNRQILEKMYNHFIFTSILNPCDSSNDKCHGVSFLMSQTSFVWSIAYFGAKTADYWRKSVKLLPVNSMVFWITNNPCLLQQVISRLQYFESLWKMLQNELCLHFGPWGVMDIFWGKIIRFNWNIAKYMKKMYNHFFFHQCLESLWFFLW